MAKKSPRQPKEEKPASEATTGTSKNHTTDAETWRKRHELSRRNQTRMFKKFSEWYNMMYAIKNYKNISIWKSKIFIPIMSFKAWTIIAKLMALDPGFAVKMYDTIYSSEDRKLIDKANLKLEQDYDNPLLDEPIRNKLLDPLTDAVVCGTGVAIVPWIAAKRKSYQHVKKNDGTIDYEQSEVTETEMGYNDLQPFNIFDFFPAPGKRNLEQKPWVILKFRKTRNELLTSGLYDEAKINGLKALTGTKDIITQYKRARNQFIGESNSDQDTIDDTVDSFDIFECYEKTSDGSVYLCTFALVSDSSGKGDSGEKGSWVSIREQKQPYWHGKYPIQEFYIRRRPHDFWGESIFEITESMANAYNDFLNQYADNLAIVGNGGILMHDTQTTVYDFYYAPGGEIRYSGPKPEFTNPEAPDVNLFSNMMALLEKGVEWGTVSGYASGTESSAIDKTQGTATGITKLQEAAGDILAFMKSNFMQSLKGIGQRWLSNNRQFMDQTVTIETQKSGKPVPVQIGPTDFTKTMYLTIDEASMQPPSREERVQNTSAWLQQMITLQERSYIQAGIQPAVKGMQPMPPQNDENGEPLAKPMLFDVERIARDITDEYGKGDFDQYLLSSESNDDSQMQHGDLTSAIRAQVENGLEPEVAQSILDQIEGRETSNEYEPQTEQPIAPAEPGSPLDVAQGAAPVYPGDQKPL